MSVNSLALEETKNIKEKGKKIFKTLTRKSLKNDEIINFLNENVITLKNDGGYSNITYYFEDKIYKRYKNLEFISRGRWKISKFGNLILFDNNNKITWKIQPGEKNFINIKEKKKIIGTLYEFSYGYKTDFYLNLEERKMREKN